MSLFRRSKKTRLSELVVTRVDAVAAGDNGPARIALAKAAPEAQPLFPPTVPSTPVEVPKTMPETPTLEDLADEDVAKIDEYVKALEKEHEAAVAYLDAFSEQKTEFEKAVAVAKGEPEPVDKDELPEPVRKRLEDAERVAKEASDRAEALEKAQRQATFKARAEALPNIPALEADQLGGVLYEVAEKVGEDSDTFKNLERVLSAADEAISKGDLFAEKGRPTGPGGEAIDKIGQVAAEIKKADPALTDEQAMVRAAESNPELAAEYQASLRDRS